MLSDCGPQAPAQRFITDELTCRQTLVQENTWCFCALVGPGRGEKSSISNIIRRVSRELVKTAGILTTRDGKRFGWFVFPSKHFKHKKGLIQTLLCSVFQVKQRGMAQPANTEPGSQQEQ